MIISHRYRFIFVRTRKVASSSLEVCLSQLLTPEDFATPQTERDQIIEAGADTVKPRLFHGFTRHGLPLIISGHAPLTKAYQLFGRRIADYRVIAAERDPWDRAVSVFYWSHRKTDMKSRPLDEQIAAFRAFVLRTGAPRTLLQRMGVGSHRFVSQRALYSIGGVSMVDNLLRFEALEQDLAVLSADLGLDKPLSVKGITAKTGFRAKGQDDLRVFHDASTRAFIETECAWEIAHYGYDFVTRALPHYTPDPARQAAKSAYIDRSGRR